MCDGMLMVWDLRMMRMIEPLALLLDPLLLRFMPSFSSRLTVASPSGQLQFVETAALTEHDMTLYQVNCLFLKYNFKVSNYDPINA